MMSRFQNCRLARMSDGHYCIVRDLGPVKGGKGLKHHEVLFDFSTRALVKSVSAYSRARLAAWAGRWKAGLDAEPELDRQLAEAELVAEDSVKSYRAARRR